MTEEHGRYAYAKRAKCPCDLCRSCTRRYDKARRLALHRGQSRRIDVTEVREHVRRLMSIPGVSYNRIAKATNKVVVEAQIRRLMEGNRQGQTVRYMLKPTVDALLAVTRDQVAGTEGLIPSVGIHRRLHALEYMGYSIYDVARLIDRTPEAVRHYFKRDVILVSTAQRVIDFYDKYSLVPGENERARWHAYRTGQLSPMCWDDETIDDPDAEPDRSCMTCVVDNCRRPPEAMSVCNSHLRQLKERGAVDDPNKFRYHVLSMGRNRGTHNHVHMHQELAELKELGVTVREAAQRSGYSPKYVEKVWSKVA